MHNLVDGVFQLPGRNILSRMPPLPGYPVSRRLKEGDMVGNFRVPDSPGHSRGHIAL